MANKDQPKMVNCRYPKCSKLHETTELLREEAVKVGSKSYYHPDCYHIMRTVDQIKDIFYREIDHTLTGKQIGQLVSIVNNLVFSKNIDVDYILFSIKYFVKNKPGALKYPGGVAYIVQDKDVKDAWKKQQNLKIRNEIKIAMNKEVSELGNINTNDVGEIGGWSIPESDFEYKAPNVKSFADILH